MFQTPRLSIYLFCIVVLGFGFSASTAHAQAGLRASLEKLDVNQDGRIEPSEITPLARPYFEKLAERPETRLKIEQPNKISRIQEAARIYSAFQSGVMRSRVDATAEPKVTPFGTTQGEPLVPEFGLAKLKYPYTQDDLNSADRVIKTYDRNKDGFIDRREALRNRWSHRNPFDDDSNGDNQLSRMELSQRYARRRLLELSSDQLRRNSERKKAAMSKATATKRVEDPSAWWRKGGSDFWLTAALMARFDANENAILEIDEAKQTGIPLVLVDVDRDGVVTREELYQYLKPTQERLGGSDAGPPDWFYEKDANLDGQVSMDEFSQAWTNATLSEFGEMDKNSDGLLTEAEVMEPIDESGDVFVVRDAQFMPPRKTTISEIKVNEDFVISDIDIQISLSHSRLSDLDGYFAGPDGQRVELFAAIGGSEDYFDNTIFDDEAESSIVAGRPPYTGSFSTAALSRKQPGLGQFNGRSSKGIWQLVIRGTRSDRPGVLHYWKLHMNRQAHKVSQ